MDLYTEPSWQIPVILVFMLGWVFLGAWVLRKQLKKEEDFHRVHYGRCVLAMIGASAAGLFAGGVMFMLINAIAGLMYTEPPMAATITSGIIALVMMFVLAYLVLWSIFALPGGRLLKRALPAFAAVVALGIVLAVPSGIIAYQRGQAKFKRALCRDKMAYIHQAMVNYEIHHAGQPAPSLQTLIDNQLIDPNRLQCPADDDNQVD